MFSRIGLRSLWLGFQTDLDILKNVAWVLFASNSVKFRFSYHLRLKQVSTCFFIKELTVHIETIHLLQLLAWTLLLYIKIGTNLEFSHITIFIDHWDNITTIHFGWLVIRRFDQRVCHRRKWVSCTTSFNTGHTNHIITHQGRMSCLFFDIKFSLPPPRVK